ISQGADLLVVSCDYDMGVSAAATAERAGKISFFLCAEDAKAGAQGVGPHSFTASVAANVQGAAIGEWAYKTLNARTAYVLLDDTIQYDKSTCAGFDWRFTQLAGTSIIGEDSFKNGDPSIASQITRIKALPKAPDVIMLCSYVPGGASAARQ